jgi:hypothetical protein
MKRSAAAAAAEAPLTAREQALFASLRDVRRELAAAAKDGAGVPAFIVCSDAVMREVCRRVPRDARSLQAIKGIGPSFITNYGGAFLAATAAFARGGAGASGSASSAAAAASYSSSSAAAAAASYTLAGLSAREFLAMLMPPAGSEQPHEAVGMASSGGAAAREACAAGCGAPASPCCRADWPTVPGPPPSYAGLDSAAWGRLYAEDKARRLASARVPVCLAPRTCGACSGQPACAGCEAWECAACARDGATVTAFEVDHETDPAVEKDPWQGVDRGRPPFCALDLKACTTCQRLACYDCRHEEACSGCHHDVCYSCAFHSAWCEGCVGVYNREWSGEFGPMHEGYCGACWAEGHAEGFIKCGNPGAGRCDGPAAGALGSDDDVDSDDADER